MSLFKRLSKLVRETGHYPCLGHKLLSFYNILLVSKKLRSLPFPGRNQPVNILVRGHAHPFAVRLGSTDWLVLVEIFLDGEYMDVSKFTSISPPETIIDLGANAGFSVRYWLEIFPKAKVIAVEPDKENCAMIHRNTALCCPLNPPRVMQACIVGQPTESVFFETASRREWAYAITSTASTTTREIRAITMEQLLAECSITGTIDLLKCDIEGAELELFKYCESWIHRVRRGAIEVHGHFTVADLLCLLAQKGMIISRKSTMKDAVCLFDSVPLH